MQKFMIRYKLLSINQLGAKIAKAKVFGALITGITIFLRVLKASKAGKTIVSGVEILI